MVFNESHSNLAASSECFAGSAVHGPSREHQIADGVVDAVENVFIGFGTEKRNRFDFQPDFFFDFAGQAGLGCFASVEEPAGHREHVLLRRLGPADEDDTVAVVEDERAGGDGRIGGVNEAAAAAERVARRHGGGALRAVAEMVLGKHE